MSYPAVSAIIEFQAAPRRCFAEPWLVLRADRLSDVRGVIGDVEKAVADGRCAVGFVTYEAAPAFDPAMVVRPGARLPYAWFGIFDGPVAGSAQDSVATADRVSVPWHLEPSPVAIKQAIEHIREEIAAGRTYQTNLTARLSAPFDAGDARGLFESLKRAQGAGYHALIDTGDFTIASASPELFFELDGRRIRTKPMKGTRARGRFRAEDEQLARELADSEKDRAENLMIVDLLRSDLGRVAATGTVDVTALYAVEEYRTVHQMTSTIEAVLRDDVQLTHVFDALFPCGSVTGAPKVSTMQLIAQLEDSPREVYCGALGIIEPGGRATFNVPIRTVCVHRETKRAVYGTGAGITYDSDADAEVAEIVAKSAVLTESWPRFELLETMRAENGRIVRLDGHVKRLLESAQYFGIAVNEANVRAHLESIALKASAPQRVRLLVAEDGSMRTEAFPCDDVTSPLVALAATPVSSADRFLFHKTTHRRVYEERLSARPDCWDVLLHNERGELTEFTRGNVVVEIDGALLTPSRTCGLLAGVFRGELLARGEIAEAVIPVGDLRRASAVWLVNSLREWLSVVVARV